MIISRGILSITSRLSFPPGVVSGGIGLHNGWQDGFNSADSLGKIATGIGFLALGTTGRWLMNQPSTPVQKSETLSLE